MQTLKTVLVTNIITCFFSSAMLPVMSVIQQSISDSTKVRTRKQPIAGHQSTAVKAQNCFYFKTKATSLIGENARTQQRQITRWRKNKTNKKKPQKHTRPTCVQNWNWKELHLFSVFFFLILHGKRHWRPVLSLQEVWGYTNLKNNSSEGEQTIY